MYRYTASDIEPILPEVKLDSADYFGETRLSSKTKKKSYTYLGINETDLVRFKKKYLSYLIPDNYYESVHVLFGWALQFSSKQNKR